jgi:hypothetical protein
MKTPPDNKTKKTYRVPEIEQIKLDNEISLVLESGPPTGPNEGLLKTPENFNNDPFRKNLT